jgi:hypothetical protein
MDLMIKSRNAAGEDDGDHLRTGVPCTAVACEAVTLHEGVDLLPLTGAIDVDDSDHTLAGRNRHALFGHVGQGLASDSQYAR